MNVKPITFDRNGKCPICRRVFKGLSCHHTFDYVMRVVEAVNCNFQRDVSHLRKQQRRLSRG